MTQYRGRTGRRSTTLRRGRLATSIVLALGGYAWAGQPTDDAAIRHGPPTTAGIAWRVPVESGPTPGDLGAHEQIDGAIDLAVGPDRGGAGWTVSVVAGGLFGGDLVAGERELTYGGAVGLGLGPGFSLEAELAAVPELRQLGGVELLLGTGSLLYHPLTVGRLTPYGMVGASLAWISTMRADTATETEVELAVDVGGGVWLWVAGPLALRADVRFIHIDNAPNFWRSAAGLTFAP